MVKIDFCKTRDVKSPTRNTSTDAGIDFFVPNFTTELDKDDKVVPNKDSQKFLDDLKEKNKSRKLTIVEPATLAEPLKILIPSGERVLIPSGIKVKISRPWYQRILWRLLGLGDALNAENKSGVANKKGLDVGSKVVDQEYRGEIHISLINTSNEDIVIESGEKVVQFLHYPIVLSKMNQISQEEYSKYENTERGTGGFGSSGTK